MATGDTMNSNDTDTGLEVPQPAPGELNPRGYLEPGEKKTDAQQPFYLPGAVWLPGEEILPDKPSELPNGAQQAPLSQQVGGDHYKSMPIQPVEYATKNRLGYLEGNALKYISRHRNKNGVEDLRKAIHCIELLIELEYGG